MDIAALVPSPDPISGPWGLFQGLSIATLVLHLLFMNAMLGSAIIALTGLLRRRPAGLADAGAAGSLLPGLIAFTVNAGVAPLLFVHVLYGPFIFTSSINMAWWWLSVVGLLLAGYAAAYGFDFRFDALGAARPWLLGAITGLLLTVAFIFTNNMTLMLAPQHWPRFLTRPGGTLLNLADPMLLPRYLHFVTASVAIGGLAMAWIWRRRSRVDNSPGYERVKRSLAWFNRATVLQFAIGGLFFLSLPASARAAFTGTDPWATGLLILSITGGLAALHLGYRRRLTGTTIATVATVAAMVAVRERLRMILLAPFFSPGDLPVDPQPGALVLFLAALLLGIGGVWFMLRLAFRSKKAAAP